MRPEFKAYQEQVVKNAQSLSNTLLSHGYKLISGGTDNHLILMDLKRSPCKIDGGRAERVLELARIATNKNTVLGDKSALIPGGMRLGSPALTSRGLVEADFEQVGNFLHEGITIATEIKKQIQGKKLSEFMKELEDGGSSFPQIGELRKRVVEFSTSFPTIGF